MEDDEDCYGFGALSDMFDNHSATTATGHGTTMTNNNSNNNSSSSAVESKRLDVAAMSRFWWSERRLGEFRRGAQRQTKEYHHIAAKFNGMRVDGGLGTAFLVPPTQSSANGRVEDGGVLWIQAQASDSNAQTRRKKEFQDITNREDALKTPKGSYKSTATVFLNMADIASVAETTMQHTVHGIRFSLHSGNHLEMSFMPGPFYDASNRDELLAAVRRQQAGDVTPYTSPSSSGTASTPRSMAREPLAPTTLAFTDPPAISRTSRSSSPNVPISETAASGSRAPEPICAVESQPPLVVRQPLGNEYKTWIRAYSELLDKSSEKATALAQQIYAATGYHVGPTATSYPKFSADAAYRKKTVDALSHTLEKMNGDWKASEAERLEHTRASCSRDESDNFQYTDAVTYDTIAPVAYAQRFMDYVQSKGQGENPVLRMVKPRIQDTTTATSSSPQITPPAVAQAAADDTAVASMNGSGSSAATSRPAMKIFGLDVRMSSFIDAAFLSKWKASLYPMEELASEWRGILFEADLTTARANVIRDVSSLIQNVQHHEAEAVASDRDASSSSPARQDQRQRQRTASRRRSLDQPSLDDFRAQFATANNTQTQDTPTKRRRQNGTGDADSSWSIIPTSPTTARRRQWQSLVGSLLAESKEEDDDEDTFVPMDTTCPLCCDADAVVVMEPCGHSVCRTCWNRLARAETVTPGQHANSDIRQCPWDRDAVSERP